MSRRPDKTGAYGAAWKLKETNGVRLSSWLFQFDDVGDHGRFVVVCVNLERFGHKVYPKATHEVHVVPVPDDANPDARRWKLSGEPELVLQFHGLGDPASSAVPEVIVNSAINGGLAPRRRNTKTWGTILTTLFLKLGGSRPRFI